MGVEEVIAAEFLGEAFGSEVLTSTAMFPAAEAGSAALAPSLTRSLSLGLPGAEAATMAGVDASTYLGGDAMAASGIGPGGFTEYALGAGGEGALAAYEFGANAGVGAPGAGGGLNWSDVKSALQIAGPAMSIGSGLYGMSQAEAMRKQALLSQNRSTPWQASGGMGLADQQLQQLMQNPGQVASQDPAYALRIQGAQRAASQYGQDSGAMSVAGANASTDWYDKRLQQLGGLAGAGVNPAGGQQVSLQGTEAANKLASSSLGSIGYGATSLGGNSMGFTPQQIAALQAAGIKLPPGMIS